MPGSTPATIDLDRLTWLYNSIEPFIWYAVAIGCWFGLRNHAGARLRALLVVLLIAFGTSDFYESEAWWTPWWLLVWKGSTLLGLAGVVWAIVAQSRRAAQG
jgi:hypothetical protein